MCICKSVVMARVVYLTSCSWWRLKLDGSGWNSITITITNTHSKYTLSSWNAYYEHFICVWHIKGANEMKVTNEMSNIQTSKLYSAKSMTLCIVKFVQLIAVFQQAKRACARGLFFREIDTYWKLKWASLENRTKRNRNDIQIWFGFLDQSKIKIT